ncbi:MAG TPA: FkbM family methyltransferase [Sphingomonas sp.]|nr:FkbM family methyltransferase [Sphingomonas sp.]
MLLDHVRRFRHQAGKPLTLGRRDFRVRGYIANGLTTWIHHEPHMNVVIRDVLEARPGAFIDVGVNTGQTLMKVLEADPDRRYVGFEPQVGCCFFVQRFIVDNALNNAQVLCMGLGDEDALVPFYSEGVVDEMASTLASSGRRASGAIVVRRGDAALAELGVDRVSVIKIDVEGAETQVLRGLRQTFVDHRPACFFEVNPNFTGFKPNITRVHADAADANGVRAGEIWQFFDELGYSIRQVTTKSELIGISAFNLDDPDKHIGNEYVALPSE